MMIKKRKVMIWVATLPRDQKVVRRNRPKRKIQKGQIKLLAKVQKELLVLPASRVQLFQPFLIIKSGS